MRNAEVIRQWNILRALDGTRLGETVTRLAKANRVTKRTIYRDLDALQEAGFPLYKETVNGERRWKLTSKPFHEFSEAGLNLTELCALYFSRTVLACLAGTPFHTDLQSAFRKFERAMPARMKEFLDRLPTLLQAKPTAIKKGDETQQHEAIARLLEATLYSKRARMRYHSLSSNRTKDYVVEPYRLVYAEGGLYLFAYVPEYQQLRTFAVERIRAVTPLEETFVPRAELRVDAFEHSLGANTGEPERIELEFASRVAPYVRERVWHGSQQMKDLPDGAIRLTLDVCADWSLRSWILSFGPFVRVISPPRLAVEILGALDEARARYRMEMMASASSTSG